MTDLLDEAQVEDRLRRTFAVRALDVPAPDAAPADGGAVDDFPLAAVGRAHRPDAPTGTDRGNRPGARAGRARARALGVAAAVLAVAGAGAALAAGGDADRGTVADEEADVTTDAMHAPDGEAGTSPTTVARPVTDDYPVALYQRGDDVLHVTFRGDATEAPDGYEEVAGQAHPTWYTSSSGDGRLSEAFVVLDGGALVLEGAGISRDALLAAAATVAFDRVTGGYTLAPPEGWDAVWTSGPTTPGDLSEGLTPAQRDEIERLAEDGAGPEGEPLGAFERSIGPGYYQVSWFAAVDRSHLAPGGVSIQVGDWPALLEPVRDDGSTVAVEVLWVLFDHGAVRVEGTGMTLTEVLAAGERVAPAPGSEELDVTPLPGYERTDG